MVRQDTPFTPLPTAFAPVCTLQHTVVDTCLEQGRAYDVEYNGRVLFANYVALPVRGEKRSKKR